MLALSISLKLLRPASLAALVGLFFFFDLCFLTLTPLLGSAVLTQLAIVLGIMFTQLFGLNLATPHLWRYVFLISFCLSALQIVFTSAVVESPAFLFRQRQLEEQKKSATRLWGNSTLSASGEQLMPFPSHIPIRAFAFKAEEPLLSERNDCENGSTQEVLTVPQVFANSDFRRPLLIVCLAMLSQQISGTIEFRVRNRCGFIHEIQVSMLCFTTAIAFFPRPYRI